MRAIRSIAGRRRGPANLRYWAGSQGMFGGVRCGSGGIEGGDAAARAPRVRLEAGAGGEVAEPAAPCQGDAAPRVERGPRHERAAPAVSPDFDPQRAAGAGAAGVKAEGV